MRDRTEESKHIAKSIDLLSKWGHDVVASFSLMDGYDTKSVAHAAVTVTDYIRKIVNETEDAVFLLNAMQHDKRFHPFTCGNHSSHRPLIATIDGWRCADCDYRQDYSDRGAEQFAIKLTKRDSAFPTSPLQELRDAGLDAWDNIDDPEQFIRDMRE